MAHLELIYLLKMVFFHSYVSLPEGSCLDCLVSLGFKHDWSPKHIYCSMVDFMMSPMAFLKRMGWHRPTFGVEHEPSDTSPPTTNQVLLHPFVGWTLVC